LSISPPLKKASGAFIVEETAVPNLRQYSESFFTLSLSYTVPPFLKSLR
jgi:hypothetical protein